jgi:hypothetical protein
LRQLMFSAQPLQLSFRNAACAQSSIGAMSSARCRRPNAMKAPVTSPSSIISASEKSVRRFIINASSIVSCAIAIRSAKSSAADSRGACLASSDSFSKSASYSSGSLPEGARLSFQRWQSFSSATRSRTSSFSANGKRPPNFAGR